PRSTTSPASSSPGMSGGAPGGAGYRPRRCIMSAPFRPAALTRTRHSPAPGVGSGWSSTLRLLSLIVTARIGGSAEPYGNRLRQDGDQRPVAEIAPRLLRGRVRQFDAAQALRRAVGGPRDVVDGVAPVEVGDPLHEVRVVRPVRVGTAHGLAAQTLVHRKRPG